MPHVLANGNIKVLKNYQYNKIMTQQEQGSGAPNTSEEKDFNTRVNQDLEERFTRWVHLLGKEVGELQSRDRMALQMIDIMNERGESQAKIDKFLTKFGYNTESLTRAKDVLIWSLEERRELTETEAEVVVDGWDTLDGDIQNLVLRIYPQVVKAILHKKLTSQ